MPTTDDVITKLRAELENLPGAARMAPLVRLGQALFERYWRAGPGSIAAEPFLDAGIEALTEGYGYFDPADPIRPQVAAMCGLLLGIRHSAHGDSDRDRESAIDMLEEADGCASMPPTFVPQVRMSLAVLYLSRVTAELRSPSFPLALMRGESSPATAKDVDRAVAYCRAVLDLTAVTSEEIRTAVGAVLATAEAVQAVLGSHGQLLQFDLSRMMQALAMMQKLQEEARNGRPATFGAQGSAMWKLFHADELTALDPLDRPTAVVHGAEPAAAEAVPESTAEPVVAAAVDRRQVRGRLYRALAAVAGTRDAGAEESALAEELLLPTAPLPPVEIVDDLVALASTVTDGADNTDPVADGVDLFALAVALHLRHRSDRERAGGADGADREAGLESLLAAARTVPPEHPAAIAILRGLGAFVDEHEPGGGIAATADSFVDRIDAVIQAGTVRREGDFAVFHALHNLCRAASGRPAADLRRAVRDVPADYPWSACLDAAVGAV